MNLYQTLIILKCRKYKTMIINLKQNKAHNIKNMIQNNIHQLNNQSNINLKIKMIQTKFIKTLKCKINNINYIHNKIFIT